jgi:hypothetical protein
MIFNIVGYIFGAGIATTLASILQQANGGAPREAWSMGSDLRRACGRYGADSRLLCATNPPSTTSHQDAAAQGDHGHAQNRPFTKYLTISMIRARVLRW